MKVKDLKQALERANDDDEVVILCKRSTTTVGPSPHVKVKYANNGFDWNHDKFMLSPAEELYQGLEDLKAQSRMLEDIAGHAFLIKTSNSPNKQRNLYGVVMSTLAKRFKSLEEKKDEQTRKDIHK